MADCAHDWAPLDGVRGRYWCQRCPATGWRSLKQWAGRIHAHAVPRPEYRPGGAGELTAGYQNPGHTVGGIDGEVIMGGRVEPKDGAE